MVGLIKVVWCFSEKQREVYGLQNTHHSLIFTRTKSGNLEIICSRLLIYSNHISALSASEIEKIELV